MSANTDHRESPAIEIDRGDTVVRILLSVLFSIIFGLIEWVLGVVVVFSLLWALLTKQPPNARLRAFANRVSTYLYRVARYLTYNSAAVPFPFSEFPEAIEEPDWDPEMDEREAIGVPRDSGAPDDEWEDERRD